MQKICGLLPNLKHIHETQNADLLPAHEQTGVCSSAVAEIAAIGVSILAGAGNDVAIPQSIRNAAHYQLCLMNRMADSALRTSLSFISHSS